MPVITAQERHDEFKKRVEQYKDAIRKRFPSYERVIVSENAHVHENTEGAFVEVMVWVPKEDLE